MNRTLLSVTSIALLWAGQVQASVGRTQSFDVGGVNRIMWAGGIGSASGGNQGSFTQMQQVSDRATGLSFQQRGRGSLNQTATASGNSLSTAGQTANIKGSQDLLAETSHGFPNRATQDLELKLDMRLYQPSGVGTVNGTQHYAGLQEQTMTTPTGTSSQSQSVDVGHTGSITTLTNIDPVVRNTLNINLHQTQVTNGQ